MEEYKGRNYTVTFSDSDHGRTVAVVNARNERWNCSLEHSSSFFERILAGTFPVPGDRRFSLRKVFKRYTQFTGPGRFPQNLGYGMLGEYHCYFDSPELCNGFRPVNPNNYSGNGRGLSFSQEQELFASMDFHRRNLHNTAQSIFGLEPSRASEVSKLFSLINSYNSIKPIIDALARTSIPLIYHRLKETRRRFPDVDADELTSALSERLLIALTLFDRRRGLKLSTYVCESLKRTAYIIAISEMKRKDSRFVEEYSPPNTSREQAQTTESELRAEMLRTILDRNLARLTENEAITIRERFENGRTEIEIGKEIGVTGQRVSQLQNKATAKVRRAFKREYRKAFGDVPV
ncbi:sigma-70 family RNA polymerase sigma factor [Candidatus Pacearchaeota archaeon]|nr:sigma-70 family RNA polymerase sigma factor [Candidatus Pacearchaeota archaeon]